MSSVCFTGLSAMQGTRRSRSATAQCLPHCLARVSGLSTKQPVSRSQHILSKTSVRLPHAGFVSLMSRRSVHFFARSPAFSRLKDLFHIGTQGGRHLMSNARISTQRCSRLQVRAATEEVMCTNCTKCKLYIFCIRTFSSLIKSHYLHE